ncbi:hypothetical protein P7K49_036343 [Saguinus oedipus]|uniref:Uncharacterized protein n=1 Tax=Saguinus oedipus TaxID=9490 RepID=A0ABQ9TKU4_SAGOE|nr:hypothetical protein P7K49_036343 [Saguinus oedipus]
MTQPLREAGGHLHKGLPGKAQAAYPTDGGGSSSGPVSTVDPRRQEVILDMCKGFSFISSMAFRIPSTSYLLTRQARIRRTEGRDRLSSDTEGDPENAEDDEEIHLERIHLKTNKHNGNESKEDKEDRAEVPQMPGHPHKEN